MVLTVGGRSTAIAFLMLAHEHPEPCARLARRLLDAGHDVVIHLDLDADDDFMEIFDQSLGNTGDGAGTLHRCRRVAVTWGEWSMVEATLAGLEALESLPATPDHVYLLSGADYPIRPLEQLEVFLARHRDIDFIEHVDALTERWVRDGPQRVRFRYWHGVNWRRHPHLYTLSLNLQRVLGRERRFPEGLAPHLGAQWWVLSWRSCKTALELARRPEIQRFFRRTWVPDELFFQTVVASRSPEAQRRSCMLTHALFTDRGTPVVFHDDHAEYLAKQPAFFARKLSPTATDLRDALDGNVSGTTPPPADVDVGGTSGAYGAFLERHQLGIPGRFSWGRLPDPSTGDLSRIDRPWLVLAGDDHDRLATARELLAGDPRIQLHGALFAADEIDFADGVREL